MGAFIIPQNRSESKMFAYQIDIYEKQGTAWGWHTLSGWTRPFTDGTRLDETLDSGTINLSNVTRDKAIKPFTRLRIIVKEGTGTNINNYVEKERIYRLVASTKRTRKRYAGTPLYDWTINTIELTKLLERRLIDTMTVTKYLPKYYDSKYGAIPNTHLIWKRGSQTDDYIYNNEVPSTIGYMNVGTVPTYQLYLPTGTIIEDNAANYLILPENGTPTEGYRYWWYEEPHTVLKKDGVIVQNNTITQPGVYTIEAHAFFNYDFTGSLGTNYEDITISWEITAFSNQFGTPKTISSVCNRLLSAGTTMRKGVESQEFLLDPTFESKYANVPSPEFSFTNCTLFEALLQIGGYIHAIPRLVPRSTSDDTHYYVTFDKLGGDEQAPTMPPFIYGENTIDVNDWCGQIDTPAQNLVNTEDVNAGSITELGNSFITVRTEDGQVEVNADNVLIRVSKPIQQILKVECGFSPLYESGTRQIGDITPYIYESAEYKTLSSYWVEKYPYSKGWALYYTQGGNTIEGLSFVLKRSSSDETAFESLYAIVNIINAVTGANLTKSATSNGAFMEKLAFRVTYVPIAQARVKAHKPSLAEGGAVNNALTYNQGANIAETSFYGEKMRGAIARLGHDVETRTYDIFHYDQLPKIGQLLDGKYIAHIDYEWDITKVRITVALTKDFNMLSQFVGLNSNYRLYDISEKQSVERNVNYDELVVVGDAPAVDMGAYLMNRQNAEMIRETFAGVNGKLAVAKLTPYDENSQEIPNRACILPAVAFPFGTSIALNVSYFDNYGAGYQITDAYSDNEDNKEVQRLVPYADQFGEIKYLKASFTISTGWTQNFAADYGDGSPAMLYPQLTTPDAGSDYITTGDNYIDLQKDSREIINLTYQLHFVSTRPSIVLGSGMAKYNPYVQAPRSIPQAKFVWLKHTINGLNRFIDIGNETLYSIQNLDVIILSGNSYVINPNWSGYHRPQSTDYKAYAIVRPVTVGEDTKYELLVGENIDNTLETLPTLTFAGALMQACNQDEPNRLKFAPQGATQYRYSILGMRSYNTLDEDVLISKEVHLVEYPDYIATGKKTTLGANLYVRRSSLVTAYDFE